MKIHFTFYLFFKFLVTSFVQITYFLGSSFFRKCKWQVENNHDQLRQNTEVLCHVFEIDLICIFLQYFMFIKFWIIFFLMVHLRFYFYLPVQKMCNFNDFSVLLRSGMQKVVMVLCLRNFSEKKAVSLFWWKYRIKCLFKFVDI